jgi:leucyl-tRNA synthetase
MDYNFAEIEKRWQEYWEKNKTFRTTDDLSNPDKFYILDMFPYPSGAGLHVGHPEGYTATDIVARYKRMKGFNVLHPMGWDAFGLPAEQYAIQTGTHPAVTTDKNCDTFRRQIKELGLSYDWDREIKTTDPDYFKWTQWIFLKLYNTWYDQKTDRGRNINELPVPLDVIKAGDEARRKYIDSKRLAYYDNAQIWYCPSCRIVCANEEVLNDGTHEKCGNRVVRRNLKQWMLRIPYYAERLLNGLDKLEWPEGIKEMQRNWIGRSTGAEVDFKIEGREERITVYTTRPDTLFGATYMVLSPEHPLVTDITSPEMSQQVADYVKAASLKSDLDRTDLAKEKTGVFTGTYAISPVNNEKIPIWVADYVLMGYGTGAIMAVPAHDDRDFEFAKKFGLKITCILSPDIKDDEQKERILKGDECWTENGTYINSSNSQLGISLDGLMVEEGIATITKWIEDRNIGIYRVNYKLRDWLFSRQRYWGEPFPVIHWDDGEITAMDESELPLNLPELEIYEPGENGESPLSNATDWLYVTDSKGRRGRRETNTMPQWAGSCWYYLRFIDPKNDNEIFDAAKEKYWMPVDLYIGGAEHAVLHLLYARFWHKVLYDLGIVSTDEPFMKLFNQGMILAFAYESSTGAKVSSDMITEKDGRFFITDTDEEVKQIVAKMSKSLKNVVNPDDVIKSYGADTFRLFEMFLGPLDATKPWDEKGIKGPANFLARTYRFLAGSENITRGDEDPEILRALHKTIKKVTDDIEHLRFNTAISAMMIFLNTALKKGSVSLDTAGSFIRLLAPFAPHLGEEMWQLTGHKGTIAYEPWPVADEKYLEEELFECPVSVNGKMRFKIELPVNLPQEEVIAIALADERAKKWIGNATPKVIVVPNRIVNIVV